MVKQSMRSLSASLDLQYSGRHLPQLVRVRAGRGRTKRLTSSLLQAAQKRSVTWIRFARNEDRCSSSPTRRSQKIRRIRRERPPLVSKRTGLGVPRNSAAKVVAIGLPRTAVRSDRSVLGRGLAMEILTLLPPTPPLSLACRSDLLRNLVNRVPRPSSRPLLILCRRRSHYLAPRRNDKGLWES